MDDFKDKNPAYAGTLVKKWMILKIRTRLTPEPWLKNGKIEI